MTALLTSELRELQQDLYKIGLPGRLEGVLDKVVDALLKHEDRILQLEGAPSVPPKLLPEQDSTAQTKVLPEQERTAQTKALPEQESTAKATVPTERPVVEAQEKESLSAKSAAKAVPVAKPQVKEASALPAQQLSPEEILKSIEPGQFGFYKVLHEPAVAMRSERSVSSTFIGAVKKGEFVQGAPELFKNELWLRTLLPSGAEAFMLIDGASQNLGLLMRPIPQEQLHTKAEKAALVAALKKPLPETPAGEGLIFIVTGGKESGGLVARRGANLGSQALETKLKTGSRIEQIEFVSNRMHYKLIRGDGPGFGWINMVAKDGRPLVEIDEQ